MCGRVGKFRKVVPMTKSDRSDPADSPTRRDNAHLPLRAGAMLLLSIAVVFIGLGWHSAVIGDSDPEAGLQAAQSRQSTSTAPPSAAPQAPATNTSSVQATTSASPRRRRPPRWSPVVPRSVSSMPAPSAVWARRSPRRSKTWAGRPRNRPICNRRASPRTPSSTPPGRRAAAEQLAEDLGGNVSVDPRPSAFSQCQGGLPLIVVTR